jgi:DNA polymerase-3 subunit epsilon
VEVALQWGLTFEDIKTIHANYLRMLVKTACADGAVTMREQEDIRLVARLLGFEEIEQTHMEALVRTCADDSGQERLDSIDGESLRGKRVCFTGDGQCRLKGAWISRQVAKEIAERHGLTVMESVTKKLDILVVADPQTQSRKATTARKYGIRIIHEPDFWRMLKVKIE